MMLVPASLYLSQKRKQLQIHSWKKSLNLLEHERNFHQLYQDKNGFHLSKQARQNHDELEYTYGEIEFLSFIALLSLANPNEQTVFYDLGAGIGKAVLACAMVYPVQKSVGVELFPQLYDCAYHCAEQLAEIKEYEAKAKKISFILGDFLEVDLDDATFIFINSSALFGPTWEMLCARIDNLPHIKTVITTSKALLSTQFVLIKRTRVTMSWGIVFAYVHLRQKVILINNIENIE